MPDVISTPALGTSIIYSSLKRTVDRLCTLHTASRIKKEAEKL